MDEVRGDSIDLLRGELELLGRARSKLDLQPALVPVLARYAEAGTIDDIFELVEGACRSLASGPDAAALALLADNDERWARNLKTRMTEAAPLVGLGSYHTLRDRKRPGGRSRYDELLISVAEAIARSQRSVGVGSATEATPGPGPGSPNADAVAGTPTSNGSVPPAAPEAPAAGADANADAEAEDPPPTRRPLPVRYVVLALTAGLVVAATLVAGRTLSGSRQPPRIVNGCQIPLASTMKPGQAPADLTTLMDGVYREVGDRVGAGCPSHTGDQRGDLWLQQLDGGSLSPPGYIVVHPASGTALWVEWSLIEAYLREARGGIQDLDGYPVRSAEMSGHPVVELSEGGMVVAHRAGGPAFWIPGPAVKVWQENGGPSGSLGMPMTAVNYVEGRLHQDYERGYLEERAPREVAVTRRAAVDVDAYLADLEPPGERILRSSDGTSWWLDADGHRRWIPDATVWSCVGGEEAVLDRRMPGWVIASFPAGEPMTCV